MEYLIGSYSCMVPLEKEIGNIREYFHIMQIQYEDRIQLEVSVDEDVMDAIIVKMSLQPIVENAVQHGLMPCLLYTSLISFSSQVENGNEFKAALDEILTQDYVAGYEKHLVCSYLSEVLKMPEFYLRLSSPPNALSNVPPNAPSYASSGPQHVFITSSPELTELLNPGYEKLKQSQKIQVNKYLLSANLPDVFGNPSNWMEPVSYTHLAGDCVKAGIRSI